MLIGEETLYKEKLQESLTQRSQSSVYPVVPPRIAGLARMEDKLVRLGEGKPDKELFCPQVLRSRQVFQNVESL